MNDRKIAPSHVVWLEAGDLVGVGSSKAGKASSFLYRLQRVAPGRRHGRLGKRRRVDASSGSEDDGSEASFDLLHQRQLLQQLMLQWRDLQEEQHHHHHVGTWTCLCQESRQSHSCLESCLSFNLN